MSMFYFAVIGGLKASLSNDNNSQEAKVSKQSFAILCVWLIRRHNTSRLVKDHNQSSLDKLQEAGASTFTSASEPTDK